MRPRILAGAVLAVLAAGCDYSRTVGNPKTGFTVTFPEKWSSAGEIKQVPDFVQQASRFDCPFDKCSRHALGTALYGRLPERMRTKDGAPPHPDDVVALVDLTLFMRGQFKDKHLRRTQIGPGEGYRIRFTVLNPQRMTVVMHAALAFHGERFLFISVSAPVKDDDHAERLIEEVIERVSQPAAPAS